jgi:hypothetical protein
VQLAALAAQARRRGLRAPTRTGHPGAPRHRN